MIILPVNSVLAASWQIHSSRNHFAMIKYFLLIFLGCLSSLYSAPEVQVGVESRDVYLNEQFLFQIKVTSQEECPPPELPPMRDFQVQAEAPQRSQSTQLSIVNGRRSLIQSTVTIFNYRLTPTRLGTLTIPSIVIKVDGTSKRTQALQISVSEPEKITGLSLELVPSVRECYVGEAVMLTWRWYIDREIHNYVFDLPIFTRSEFAFPEYLPEIDRRRERQYQRVGNRQQVNLIGLQSNVTHKGKKSILFSFEYPLIPKQAGIFALPDSSLTCTITDNRPNRGGRRNQSFMDDFFFSEPRNTRGLTLTAPPVTLTVKPLPQENQPADFSGIIGSCSIETRVEPTAVNVGDPILMDITLSGPRFLDPVRLPPLENQPALARDFKISGTEPGIIKGERKVFQRTLRASNPDVTAIPALEISYFNTGTGKYETARSQPIPISVTAARQVTVQDAQGSSGPQADSPVGQELEFSEAGIAHNYEVEKLLPAQSHDPRRWLSQPVTILALAAAPGVWLFLLSLTTLYRAHHANPRAMAARRAAGKCLRALRALRGGGEDSAKAVFVILQDYFQAKFQLPPGVVTYQDLEKLLAGRNYPSEFYASLRTVLDSCEASRFAGGGGLAPSELVPAAIESVKRLERGK